MSDDRPAVFVSVEERQLAALRKLHAEVIALVGMCAKSTDPTDTPEAVGRETQQGIEE